jgi:hypothetical protein
MVAPVTGPFSTSLYVNGPPTSLGYKPQWLSATRVSFRQHRPYDAVLPYSLVQKRVTRWEASIGSHYVDTTQVHYGFPQSMIDQTYNECYRKFVGKLKEEHDSSGKTTTSGNAGVGTTLAEINQARDMITRRLEVLVRFTKAVRGYRFYDAYNILGMHKAIANRDAWMKSTRLRRSAKSFGDNWLEFHFGWEPLFADITQAMEVLTGGLPDFKVFARCKRIEQTTINLPSGSPLVENRYSVERWEDRVQIGSRVGVSNPNLWLANRLGLINPLALAWERVPFSFVLDWVANLNDVIGSHSDFFGLTLKGPYFTEVRVLTYTLQRNRPSIGFFENYATEFVAMGRTVGIPGPTLRMRPAKALSWQRGLTAASLLLQRLKAP